MKNKVKKVLDYIKKPKLMPIIEQRDERQLLGGKVALIVGGSGGIGSAIAKKFVNSGCKVIIAGTNEKKLKHITKELDCKYITADLMNIKSFNRILEQAIKCYDKIDILVNSAGVHVNRSGLSFLTTTEAEYDKVMNINLKATYFLSQVFAKYFIDHEIAGHILMISSQSALEPSWSPYRLSKRGLEGITQGMAQELIRYNIVVNGIGPGPTATNMQNYSDGDVINTELNPIGRYTMPEEVGEYAAMLVSPLGDTIVGDTIYMSGGRGIIELR